MLRFLHYFGRFQGLRSEVGSLPGWARLLLGVTALPGILLIALSILAFVVSLLALLLVTAPVYRVLQTLTSRRAEAAAESVLNESRRHVQVTILE